MVTRDGMLGLAELDGELVAVFETDEDGIMHIKCVNSPGTSPCDTACHESVTTVSNDSRRWKNVV
jgi:hypothetical protein